MTNIETIGTGSLDTVVALDKATNGVSRRDFFVKRFGAQEKHPQAFISLGAIADGNMVGFICCHMLKGEFGSDDLIAVLDAMSVDPEVQGHGVGHEKNERRAAPARGQGRRCAGPAPQGNHAIDRVSAEQPPRL